MNIRQCEVLVAINQTHSITKAASALGLTQPTVSFHMKNLEQEIEETLFISRSGEIQLSESAIILLEYAKKILVLEKEARQQVSTFSFNGTRPLHIGASSVAACTVLPDTIRRFHQTYPGVKIILESFPTPEIEKKVSQFKVDFGVVCTNTPGSNPKIDYIPLFKQEMALVYSNENKWINENMTIQEILNHQPFILHTYPSSSWQFIEDYRKANHLELNVQVEASSTDLIKTLVLETFGVSILPLAMVEKEIEKKELKFIPLTPKLTRDVYLLISKDRVLPKTILDFLKIIQDQ